MHLDSFNEADFEASGAGGGPLPPPPDIATKNARRRLSAEGDAEKSSPVMDCPSDLSGLSDLSHASYSRCLVLASIPELMNAVQMATGSGGGSLGSL